MVDYATLSPGIRRVVKLINSFGFETTDSGDGSNAEAGMECAVDCPMVYVSLSGPRDEKARGMDRADELWAKIKEHFQKAGLEPPDDVRVEQSYSPIDGHCGILISNLADKHLPED